MIKVNFLKHLALMLVMVGVIFGLNALAPTFFSTFLMVLGAFKVGFWFNTYVEKRWPLR